jgi:glycine cleavage system H protein
MKTIKNLKYTKEHEWINVSENSATIGITDFAQGELGDIVFVELPNLGDLFSKDDVFGTVEAVKTVADLYIPISGKVIAVNEELESNPELINSNPYDKGWIIEIELNDPSEMNTLLSHDKYEELIK